MDNIMKIIGTEGVTSTDIFKAKVLILAVCLYICGLILNNIIKNIFN